MSTLDSRGLVLITGGNGFIGLPIVAKALEEGYRVRASVRRQDAADFIREAPSIQRFLGQLECPLVPDIMFEGAFSKAVEGCTHIIHLASQIAVESGIDFKDVAVRGTQRILEAAQATQSMKRVVICSSPLSIRDFESMIPDHSGNHLPPMLDRPNEPMTVDVKRNDMEPIKDEPYGRQYIRSRRAARNYVSQYMEEHSTHFSVVTLLTGFVLGRSDRVRKRSDFFYSSNFNLAWLFSDVRSNKVRFGGSDETPEILTGESIHIDDNTEAYINALDVDRVPGRFRDFLLCSDEPSGPTRSDAVEIIKKELPELAKQIPFASKAVTLPTPIDCKGADQELLGRPLKPYRVQVIDAIRWYFTLDASTDNEDSDAPAKPTDMLRRGRAPE